jgi:hypothetical protein
MTAAYCAATPTWKSRRRRTDEPGRIRTGFALIGGAQPEKINTYRGSNMRKTTAFLAATVAVLAFQPALAADKIPPAQNVITKFVNKGSASAVLAAMNKLHAEMEAQGWVYSDMAVYTEDGDLEGLFVTYIKTPAPPPMATPLPPAN